MAVAMRSALKELASHLTYANVMATVAVFIALGGASYAAVQLPRDSVGRAQLRDNTVTMKKIAPHTRNALKGNGGPAGAPGAPGASGDHGVPGPTGATGADGVPSVAMVDDEPGSAPIPTDGSTATIAQVDLPAGSWTIAAGTTGLNFHDSENAVMLCQLNSGGVFANAQTTILPGSSGTDLQPEALSINTAYEDDDPSTVTLICQGSGVGGGDLFATSTTLVATRVKSLG